MRFAEACRPRMLGIAAAAAAGLPWLAGAFAKQFYQPGLVPDAERSTQMIDFIVIGGVVFGLTMVATLAVGCWIVATLKGPHHVADSFPVDHPRRPADDARPAGDDARHADPR